MKEVIVYDYIELAKRILKHMDQEYESYIKDALFEWCMHERFIHLNVHKLEDISDGYKENGLRSLNDGRIPNKVQKWIEIINELIIMIESAELPEEFMVDYESDLYVYK